MRRLQRRGSRLVLLPDGVSETELVREVRDADLLLTCYTPVTSRVIEQAEKVLARAKQLEVSNE